MTPYKVDFASIPWETLLKGARFKAYRQAAKQLRLLELAREFVEPDWCRKGHVGYVLEGRMEIDFSGKAVTFNPGDGLFIPQGEEHKHRAKVLTDKVRLIMVEEVS